tara:strand:- start:1639 stop:1782 length:144 start_codon:yes stop_codon:yes gene_type:complete
MPKRKDNSDPVFKKDIVKTVNKDKYINPKKVFDYKKDKKTQKKKSKY